MTKQAEFILLKFIWTGIASFHFQVDIQIDQIFNCLFFGEVFWNICCKKRISCHKVALWIYTFNEV